MRIRRTFVAITAASAVMAGLVACSVFGTQGQGDVRTESRTVPAFVRVAVDNGIRATIAVGPDASVQVKAQPNILPLIATDVADGTLRVHATGAFQTDVAVEVDISNPDLEFVSLGGGSHAAVTPGDVDSFQIALSGGSNMTATGTTSALALQASGGSRADLGALHAMHVALDMSGGSNATVSATGTVTGTASGGSKATVLGGGAIDVEATGGSSVTPG